jgi:hypothetical protein
VIVTWHSPAEMLPQVGQETWLLLVADCGRMVRLGTFVQGGFGTEPVWSLGSGITIRGTEAYVRGWCPKDAINLD